MNHDSSGGEMTKSQTEVLMLPPAVRAKTKDPVRLEEGRAGVMPDTSGTHLSVDLRPRTTTATTMTTTTTTAAATSPAAAASAAAAAAAAATENGSSNPTDTLLGLTFSVMLERDVREIKRYIRMFVSRQKDKERKNQIAMEWRTVALVLDRLFFCLYVIAITVAIIILLPKRSLPESILDNTNLSEVS